MIRFQGQARLRSHGILVAADAGDADCRMNFQMVVLLMVAGSCWCGEAAFLMDSQSEAGCLP